MHHAGRVVLEPQVGLGALANETLALGFEVEDGQLRDVDLPDFLLRDLLEHHAGPRRPLPGDNVKCPVPDLDLRGEGLLALGTGEGLPLEDARVRPVDLEDFALGLSPQAPQVVVGVLGVSALARFEQYPVIFAFEFVGFLTESALGFRGIWGLCRLGGVFCVNRVYPNK